MRNKKCCVKQNFRMDILTSQHEGFPQQLSSRYSVQSLPGYGTHNAMRCDQLQSTTWGTPTLPWGAGILQKLHSECKRIVKISHLRRGWKSSDKVVWLIAIYRSVQCRSHCHWHCNCRQPGRAALMGLQATCCLPATGRGRSRVEASTCAHPATFQVFALVTCTDWASAAATAAAAGNRQQRHRKDIRRGH